MKKTNGGALAEALEQLRPLCPCGRRFTPVRPQQRFCRPSCRTAKRAPDLLDVTVDDPLEAPGAFADGESEE